MHNLHQSKDDDSIMIYKVFKIMYELWLKNYVDFFRLERLRSQSFDEEATNRRQLPNVPKKPVRQSSSSRDNREPTPDYDSTGDKGI